eukprot:gene9094-6387_t
MHANSLREKQTLFLPFFGGLVFQFMHAFRLRKQGVWSMLCLETVILFAFSQSTKDTVKVFVCLHAPLKCCTLIILISGVPPVILLLRMMGTPNKNSICPLLGDVCVSDVVATSTKHLYFYWEQLLSVEPKFLLEQSQLEVGRANGNQAPVCPHEKHSDNDGSHCLKRLRLEAARNNEVNTCLAAVSASETLEGLRKDIELKNSSQVPQTEVVVTTSTASDSTTPVVPFSPSVPLSNALSASHSTDTHAGNQSSATAVISNLASEEELRNSSHPGACLSSSLSKSDSPEEARKLTLPAGSKVDEGSSRVIAATVNAVKVMQTHNKAEETEKSLLSTYVLETVVGKEDAVNKQRLEKGKHESGDVHEFRLPSQPSSMEQKTLHPSSKGPKRQGKQKISKAQSPPVAKDNIFPLPQLQVAPKNKGKKRGDLSMQVCKFSLFISSSKSAVHDARGQMKCKTPSAFLFLRTFYRVQSASSLQVNNLQKMTHDNTMLRFFVSVFCATTHLVDGSAGGGWCAGGSGWIQWPRGWVRDPTSLAAPWAAPSPSGQKEKQAPAYLAGRIYTLSAIIGEKKGKKMGSLLGMWLCAPPFDKPPPLFPRDFLRHGGTMCRP